MTKTKIFDLIEHLRVKHPNYVVFSMTESYDHQKNKYSTDYNIYTPDINHNRFTTLEGFEKFMLNLINDDVFYRTRSKARIDSEIEYARERLEDAKEDLAYAEQTLKEYEAEQLKQAEKARQ